MKGVAMNWDRIEGQWKQRRGKAMHHWGRLMHDELAAIAGEYENLVGRLQERYGIARDEANQQVKDFEKTISQLKESNKRLIQSQKSLHGKKKAGRKRATLRHRVRKKSDPS